MMKNCSPEAMYSSDKVLITLEESHFHAAKMPNRGSVDARYLWFEGLMNLEESYFQAKKSLKRLSQNPCTFSQGLHDAQESRF